MNQPYPYAEFELVARTLLAAEFQVAKTMPDNPHAYTLRKKWADQPAFDRAVTFIRRYGYKEKFKGATYTLLNVNEHKYWTMGWPVDQTILINRKLRFKDGPGTPEDAVAAPYDAIAEAYDTLFTDAESEAENVAVMQQIEALAGRHLGSVLDVGCGTPVTVISKGMNDRMASTIRHNRARGKHSIRGMSSLVFQMLDGGWDDAAICNELGMEPEELLRLKHLTGFSKLFADREYNRSWLMRRQILHKEKWDLEHPDEPKEKLR